MRDDIHATSDKEPVAGEFLHTVFQSTPDAVRDVLQSATTYLEGCGASEADMGTAQIVLAEVLNNIVEHAYQDRGYGEVDFRLRHAGSELHCHLKDRGQPMPGGTLPSGEQGDRDVDLMDLPEGGFGWHLIRTLTSELVYERRDGANCLCLVIPLTPA